MDTTTWRSLLRECMEVQEDKGPVLAWAPSEDAFDVTFYPGFGGAEGPSVLAWTADYVYFPAVYDGSEWIDSAPRNPRPEGQRHVGGQ